jgi:O-antigen/teichoic acid export membrane protein
MTVWLIRLTYAINPEIINMSEESRDYLYFMACSAISTLILFISGILTKKWLGPSDFGVWTIGYTALTYLLLVDLGMTGAVSKWVPFLNGKDNRAKGSKLIIIFLKFILCITSITWISIVLYYYHEINKFDNIKKEIIIFIICAFPLFIVQQSLTTILWIYKDFKKSSLIIISESILNAIISIALTKKFGLTGFYGAFVIVLFIKCVALYFVSKKYINMEILKCDVKLEELKELLNVAIPIQFTAVANLLRSTIILIIISNSMSSREVGIYSFGINIQNFILLVPNVFWIIMSPRFHERYASTNKNSASLESFYSLPFILFCCIIFPLMIGFCYLVAIPTIKILLPDFAETGIVLKIMLIGTYFLALDIIPDQVLLTVNKIWLRTIIAYINILMILCIPLIYDVHKMTLNDFAFVATIIYFLSFLAKYFIASQVIYDKLFHSAKYLCIIIISLGYTIFILYVLEGYQNLNIQNIIISIMVNFAIFIILSSPLLFYATRKMLTTEPKLKNFIKRYL